MSLCTFQLQPATAPVIIPFYSLEAATELIWKFPLAHSHTHDMTQRVCIFKKRGASMVIHFQFFSFTIQIGCGRNFCEIGGGTAMGWLQGFEPRNLTRKKSAKKNSLAHSTDFSRIRTIKVIKFYFCFNFCKFLYLSYHDRSHKKPQKRLRPNFFEMNFWWKRNLYTTNAGCPSIHWKISFSLRTKDEIMRTEGLTMSSLGRLVIANKVAQLKKENLLNYLHHIISPGWTCAIIPAVYRFSLVSRSPFSHPVHRPSKEACIKKECNSTHHYLLCLILHQRHQHVAF